MAKSGLAVKQRYTPQWLRRARQRKYLVETAGNLLPVDRFADTLRAAINPPGRREVPLSVTVYGDSGVADVEVGVLGSDDVIVLRVVGCHRFDWILR